MHIYRRNALLNSNVMISCITQLPPCSKREQIPQPFDHLRNVKASAIHFTSPVFLSLKPTCSA